MLVLSRRIGEVLIIGQKGDVLEESIDFTILGIKAGQVRIGIKAQRNLRVDRAEIRARIEREKLQLISGRGA